MADIKRTTEGLEHCIARYVDGLCDDCPYMGEIDRSYMIPMKCKEIIMRDALELLKGYKKFNEQLKELQIIENSRVKDCDSACDLEAMNYHRGRFDAYNIALAHFDQKDGEHDVRF